MHVRNRAERNQLNAMIRRGVKSPLGLPSYTYTDRLLRLGTHNTLEEITEAQQRVQVFRISGSKVGRRILADMGTPPPQVDVLYQGLTRDQKANVIVSPVPKNMHPQQNIGRARTLALLRWVEGLPGGACFVDSAEYDDNSNRLTVVAINHNGLTIIAASVCAQTGNAVKPVAIAMAFLDHHYENIYSDSRAAVRAFSVGTV